VLFFDGLFSNLTDRRLIDEAFKGLGEADSNLQLVGLIHNTEYRNNSKIFPSYVVGRRVGNRDVEGERSYVRFEDNRPEGSMGLATFMHKRRSATRCLRGCAAAPAPRAGSCWRRTSRPAPLRRFGPTWFPCTTGCAS
jgi:hypothetical protein